MKGNKWRERIIDCDGKELLVATKNRSIDSMTPVSAVVLMVQK